MTTTQIGTFNYTIPAEFYGDFASDFDTVAINAEVLAKLNALLPDGVTIAANGMIFAEAEVADAAREIDYREVLDQIEVDAIIIKHETRAMV